ncbi:MAG: 4Fe-4S dicluster domain-containing protein [Chloroflexota bacterium]
MAETVGFLTDSTLCIGCKACEVACKQWNQLPMDGLELTARSYDNTGDLGAETWRHVTFVEQLDPTVRAGRMPPFQSGWLMLSDVCKHCANAGCMEACPTGAIVRTEFGTVLIQQDICNGCGYCVPACPFGVPELSELDGRAHKCTLCYDRLKDGLEPACAKSCPTNSIQFGPVADLRDRAQERVARLRDLGVQKARVYGDSVAGGTGGIGGLNAMSILIDDPEVYNLPAAPRLPQDETLPGMLTTLAAAVGAVVAIGWSIWSRR